MDIDGMGCLHLSLLLYVTKGKSGGIISDSSRRLTEAWGGWGLSLKVFSTDLSPSLYRKLFRNHPSCKIDLLLPSLPVQDNGLCQFLGDFDSMKSW